METEEGEVVVPPGLEGKVEIFSQVENIEGQPADNEQDDGGYQKM